VLLCSLGQPSRSTQPMLTRICTALLFLLFARTLPLHAQDQSASAAAGGPITTDRPAVTDSSLVVPAGSLQLENGFLETRSQGQSVLDGPETLLRFGVTARTELRFTAPDYFHNLTTGQGSGFGDLAIGIKQQLGPTHGFDVSAVVFLSLPTGANFVSSGGYDPGLQIPWSRAVSANWTAAGMFSVYWPTQGRTRNVTGESTFLFDRQLTKPWDAFLEYAGDFPESGAPRHLLHFGTALKLAKQQQIDFHVGVGLSPAALDHFIGIGYSFRLQTFSR
jgi:Putative MetA-pathway of phenol degradation